ncbi:MAG: rod shape determining protein RodA [Chthoniobacter sp.]|jgi:rod shape determining protein RodA|nr:rod shape determining protein RodA [Chthoniobacter sp.]
MTPLLRKFLGMNWVLFALTLALAGFGVVAIYNATFFREDLYWRHQAAWVAIGIVAFFSASLVDYRWVRWGALPMYLGGLALLVLVLVIGRKVSGAKSWLVVGPVNFQPSQLAAIAGIMVLSLFLSQFRNMHPLLRLIFCGIIVGAPALLVLKQPDFGVTMMWGPVVLALLFVGGIPMRYMISLFLGGLIALPVLINFVLKPYQKARITAFLDPEIDPHGAGWAINQSMIAIGSGGWAGKGFKAPNTQLELGFLPSTTVHSDYIFAAIGETWGFLGGVVMLAIFAMLILVCLNIALRAADDLGVLLCVGFTTLLFAHVFQNVGMTVALMPITGVPLPLVSYSGSFVLMMMFALGIVNSVFIHRKALLT